MSRRDALSGLAAASTVLVAGCSATNDSNPPANETENETPNQSVTVTTPHTAPNGSSGEFPSNDTDAPTATPTGTTNTPTTTPTSTPTTTLTEDEDEECGLEFSRDVMEQARSVGLEARQGVVWLYHNEAGKDDIMGGIGTGWFIDDTHIVTNGHIVDGYTDKPGSYRAITINNTSLELELIDYIYKDFPTRDVALLEVTTGSAPHTLSLGNSDTLNEGQPVIQIGHPATIGYWLIALGEYTGETKGSNADSLTSEIPSYSGNSGSPMLTLDGNVHGLHWGSTSSSEPGPPTPIDEDVTEARVYTELPYQKQQKAMAQPIESVADRIDTWQN